MDVVSCWPQPKEESELIKGMFSFEDFNGLPNLHMDCPVLITKMVFWELMIKTLKVNY